MKTNSEKKLVWSRLKDYKCPKCRSDMRYSPAYNEHACVDPKCAMRISDERFKEIANNLYKPYVEHVEEECQCACHFIDTLHCECNCKDRE